MGGVGEQGYVIVADTAGPGAVFARQVYERVREKSKEFTFSGVDFQRFRDGEVKPRILDNVRGKVCYFVHDSSKLPAEWFLELVLVNDALMRSSAKAVIDVFPYLRFSRQDRKDESRVPISSAVVARAVNGVARSVLTVDVHNPAIEGSYGSRFDNLHSFPMAVAHVRQKIGDVTNLVVMSPDAGGAGRAEAFAKRLGATQIAFGYKSRKEAGVVDSLRVAGDVTGKDVLLVDDIIDSGGTLLKAATVLRTMGGRKIYAYCTHGLFTKGVDAVVSSFDLFFVSDTVLVPEHPKIEVVTLVPLFAEAIYRMSAGASLSELFN
jgi:ribose-phosphate pyrophosphokinase